MNGIKVYKYEGDELQTYRIIKSKEDNVYLQSLDKKGKLEVVTNDQLNSQYVQLTPDAFMNIMSTTSKGPNGDDIKDVFVCIHKSAEMLKNPDPHMVIRQNCLSNSKGGFVNTMDVYVGDCYRDDTLMAGTTMRDIMEFDKIENTFSVGLYVDDTMTTIFKCIPQEIDKKFADILKVIKASNKSKMVKGFSLTLTELLNDNNFMLNYRALFNILQVDFPIVIDERSTNDEGNIVLNKKQQKKLEDTIGQYIKVIAVIKYDRDIDVAKIVSYNHIMISDKSGIIYLIAYQKIGDYKVDNDIADALGITQ
jgi:hypothetical protein